MAEWDQPEKRSTAKGASFRTGTGARDLIYTVSRRSCRIIEEAARLPSPNGIRALTFATLFGLIAVTGLRVSEAIALDGSDVDLENGVLTVRRGKSGRARIVPISKTTAERLTAYAAERDRLLGCTPKPFFVSDTGNRPDDCSARYNFATVCQRIGLRRRKGSTSMGAARASTIYATPSPRARW